MRPVGFGWRGRAVRGDGQHAGRAEVQGWGKRRGETDAAGGVPVLPRGRFEIRRSRNAIWGGRPCHPAAVRCQLSIVNYQLSIASHPGYASLQTRAHGSGIEMDWAAMAGEDPFEAIVEQSFHRADLLAPRVPAGAAECVEVAAALAPGEMIAGEEIAVAIEKHCVAFRVAGSRDHHDVVAEGDRIDA